MEVCHVGINHIYVFFVYTGTNKLWTILYPACCSVASPHAAVMSPLKYKIKNKDLILVCLDGLLFRKSWLKKVNSVTTRLQLFTLNVFT